MRARRETVWSQTVNTNSQRDAMAPPHYPPSPHTYTWPSLRSRECDWGNRRQGAARAGPRSRQSGSARQGKPNDLVEFPSSVLLQGAIRTEGLRRNSRNCGNQQLTKTTSAEGSLKYIALQKAKHPELGSSPCPSPDFADLLPWRLIGVARIRPYPYIRMIHLHLQIVLF